MNLRAVIFHCAAKDLVAARNLLSSMHFDASLGLTGVIAEQIQVALEIADSPASASPENNHKAGALHRSLTALDQSEHSNLPSSEAESGSNLLEIAINWAGADLQGKLDVSAAQIEKLARVSVNEDPDLDLLEQAAVLYFQAGEAEAARRVLNELPPNAYRALLSSLFASSEAPWKLNAEASSLSIEYCWSQVILEFAQCLKREQAPSNLRSVPLLPSGPARHAAEFFFEFEPSADKSLFNKIPELTLSLRLIQALKQHDLAELEQLERQNPGDQFLGHLIVAEYELRVRNNEVAEDLIELRTLKLSLAEALHHLSENTTDKAQGIGWKVRGLFVYLDLDEAQHAELLFKQVLATAPLELSFHLKTWLLRLPALQNTGKLREFLGEQFVKDGTTATEEQEDTEAQQAEQLLELLVIDLAEKKLPTLEIREALQHLTSPALNYLKSLLGLVDTTSAALASSQELLLSLDSQLQAQSGLALETARQLGVTAYENGLFSESLTACLLALTLAKEAARGASPDDYAQLARSYRALKATSELSELDTWHEISEYRNEQAEPKQTPHSVLLAKIWTTLEHAQPDSESIADNLDLFATASANENPENTEVATAKLLAAYELLIAEDYQEAQSRFKSIETLFEKDVTYYQGRLNSSQHLKDLGDQIHCLIALSQFLESRKSQAAASYQAGLLSRQYEPAAEDSELLFSRALELQPDHANAFHQLYRLVKKRGDRLRLVELIDARLEIDDQGENRQQLLWAKSVYCRNLGRRNLAAGALKQLLTLAPKHLAATAMQAEIAFSDGKYDLAADALKAFSSHPELEQTLRLEAGLAASDLLENRHRPREAVELLQTIQSLSSDDQRIDERLARTAARAGEWDLAYVTYGKVAGNTDDLSERLRASKIRLAIQRDHLRTYDQIQDAARQVLRDSPLDTGAIDVVLEENFSVDEKQRLLEQPLVAAREELSRSPLNPSLIKRFSHLSIGVDSSNWRLSALGIYALISPLSDRERSIFSETQACYPREPETKLPKQGREWLFAPSLRGLGEEVMQLIGPALSQCIEPALEALGVSGLMKWPAPAAREPDTKPSTLELELRTWLALVGIEEIDIYVGGSDPHALIFLDASVPQLIIGEGIRAPLTPAQKARTATGALLASRRAGTLLSISPQEAHLWLTATAFLAQETLPDTFKENTDLFRDQIAPRARQLKKALGSAAIEELQDLKQRWSATGVQFLSELAEAARHTAARVATFTAGEPSILRQLSENLPADKSKRNQLLGSVIAFTLSDDFMRWRQFVGLSLHNASTISTDSGASELVVQPTLNTQPLDKSEAVKESSDE